MKLNEIFKNSDCKIFKVINFYEAQNIEDWLLEKTNFQLIPEPTDELYDAYFVVKGFLINNGEIEDCYLDVCIPERISEFVFRNKNDCFTIENAFENNLKAIPAVASELYGDSDLYYLKENPKLGLQILEKGKQISNNAYAIDRDLTYIREEME